MVTLAKARAWRSLSLMTVSSPPRTSRQVHLTRPRATSFMARAPLWARAPQNNGPSPLRGLQPREGLTTICAAAGLWTGAFFTTLMSVIKGDRPIKPGQEKGPAKV